MSQSPSQIPLNSEQEAFVKRWSAGALLGLIYFFASRLIEQGLLMLVPVYNIYLAFKGIFRGRRMVWASGKWSNFDEYKRRQQFLDRLAVGVIVCTILLSVGGIYLAYKVTDGAAVATQTFLTNIQTGKIHEAYEATSKEFKEYGDEERFNQFLQQLPELQSAKHIQLNGRSVATDNGVTTGVVHATLTDDKGEINVITINLIKEDGAWKVRGIEPAV